MRICKPDLCEQWVIVPGFMIFLFYMQDISSFTSRRNSHSSGTLGFMGSGPLIDSPPFSTQPPDDLTVSNLWSSFSIYSVFYLCYDIHVLFFVHLLDENVDEREPSESDRRM